MTQFEESCIKRDTENAKKFYYCDHNCDNTVYMDSLLVIYPGRDDKRTKFISRKRRKQMKMRRQYKNSL